MAINFPVTQWFFALLLLIVAAGAGTGMRWLFMRLFGWDAVNWKSFFVLLFFLVWSSCLSR